MDGGNESFGCLLTNLGDINGDGYDDIFAGPDNTSDTIYCIYHTGPDFDTTADIIITDIIERSGAAGDVNNDGYNDLIASFPPNFSNLCRVYLYLGGPEMDSIPDYIFVEDDIPGYQNYWGNGVGGVGDVNGDGIDDFAFSAFSGEFITSQGVIYIYAGWDEFTDVEYEYDPVIPEKYQLEQNYPNPFNLATKISFDIKQHSKVKLEIFNLLGKKITTLINKQLPAGSYNITWNGTDENNNTMPSGVYFYQLHTDNHTSSKKMILLK